MTKDGDPPPDEPENARPGESSFTLQKAKGNRTMNLAAYGAYRMSELPYINVPRQQAQALPTSPLHSPCCCGHVIGLLLLPASDSSCGFKGFYNVLV